MTKIQPKDIRIKRVQPKQIQCFRLTKEVRIDGRDVFGRKAYLVFTPSKRNGWYVRDQKTKEEIPLCVDHIVCKKNNLTFSYGGTMLHVLEHIMPLRWLGIDKVCLSGSPWPPYLTAFEYFEYLENADALVATDSHIETFPITGAVVTGSRSAKRFSMFRPRHKVTGDMMDLVVRVEIDYSSLGLHHESYGMGSLHRVMDSHPQGYPLYRYYVAQILAFFGWPHLDRVVWPQRRRRSFMETLIAFCDHRALDIFGALAMISHTKLPNNFIFDSRCSGHSLDLALMKRLRKILKKKELKC